MVRGAGRQEAHLQLGGGLFRVLLLDALLLQLACLLVQLAHQPPTVLAQLIQLGGLPATVTRLGVCTHRELTSTTYPVLNMLETPLTGKRKGARLSSNIVVPKRTLKIQMIASYKTTAGLRGCLSGKGDTSSET